MELEAFFPSLLLLILPKLHRGEYVFPLCSSSSWATCLKSTSQCHTLLYAQHPSFALSDNGQGLKTTPSRWAVLSVQCLPGIIWDHRGAHERLWKSTHEKYHQKGYNHKLCNKPLTSQEKRSPGIGGLLEPLYTSNKEAFCTPVHTSNKETF